MAVRTRIDPVAMQSMFVRGGDVYQFAVKVSDDVRSAARRRIRNRTRELWRSVTASRHTLPLGVKFTVGAYARHADWVENGTRGMGTGFIYPHKRRGWLVLYAGYRAAPAKYMRYEGSVVRKVRGQKPRRYLRNGLIAGLTKNGLVGR